MERHVSKKLLSSALTLLVLVSVNSVIFRVLAPFRPPEFVIWSIPIWMREHFVWDQPVYIGFVKHITDMFSLNFGTSFLNRQPVIADLWKYLPNTLLLLVPAFIFMIMVSVPLEIYGLTRKGRTFKMRLLALGAGLFTWAIPAKNRLIDAHLEDYMLLRRAMGFDEHTTIYKLIFANTLPLVLAVVAFSIPYLISGTLVVERLLSLHGIGTWFTKSLMAMDRPVVEALLFVYLVLTVSASFLTSLISTNAR